MEEKSPAEDAAEEDAAEEDGSDDKQAQDTTDGNSFEELSWAERVAQLIHDKQIALSLQNKGINSFMIPRLGRESERE